MRRHRVPRNDSWANRKLGEELRKISQLATAISYPIIHGDRYRGESQERPRERERGENERKGKGKIDSPPRPTPAYSYMYSESISSFSAFDAYTQLRECTFILRFFIVKRSHNF